ncbi:MAG: hypothetical protein ACLVJH_17170 [Faecalibacterium prausnitzii]
MNLMHSCYACGALLCPFLIAAAARVSTELAVFLLAAVGLVLWLVYVFTAGCAAAKCSIEKEAIDWSSALCPLLAADRSAVLPERRRAERQRLDGDLLQGQRHHCGHAGGLHRHCDVGRYAGGTVAHRLCVPLKKSPQGHGGHERAVHRVLCAAGHGAHAGHPAIALLFAFAISMSGLNPTAVASAGRMTSVTSMGIMLPVASSGAILMPWVIGMVAERAGLAAGMASNIVPCVGLVVFTLLVARLPEE